MRTRETSGNVLVVEDDASARSELRRILEGSYNVIEAESGGDALAVLRTHSIDTVTLDPWLTGMQGRELLTRIREADPGVRVIIVTEHRLSLWFDDMVREEVFDYVPKPFLERDLMRSIRRSMVRPEAACPAR